MKTPSALALCCLVLALPALAQDAGAPSPEKLELARRVVAAPSHYINRLDNDIQELVAAPPNIARAAPEEWAVSMQRAIAARRPERDAFAEALVKDYVRLFSDDELTAILAYLEGPVGKSIYAKERKARTERSTNLVLTPEESAAIRAYAEIQNKTAERRQMMDNVSKTRTPLLLNNLYDAMLDFCSVRTDCPASATEFPAKALTRPGAPPPMSVVLARRVIASTESPFEKTMERTLVAAAKQPPTDGAPDIYTASLRKVLAASRKTFDAIEAARTDIYAQVYSEADMRAILVYSETPLSRSRVAKIEAATAKAISDSAPLDKILVDTTPEEDAAFDVYDNTTGKALADKTSRAEAMSLIWARPYLTRIQDEAMLDYCATSGKCSDDLIAKAKARFANPLGLPQK